MMDLVNRVAIVTGGAKGIGKAIAFALAEKGAKVVINYNNSEADAKAVVDELFENGYEALAVQANVAELDQAKALIDRTVEHFGRLDVIVNNAGITRDRSFKKLSAEDWHEVIDVNLSSVYNTCNSALPYLLESDNARIINISSVIGQAGGFGQTNYSAAKAGMIGFTKSLALELAKTDVTVNSVCPGFIETDMVREIPENVQEQIKSRIPKRRFGTVEEIAKAVIYLCEGGEYITGQQINVNGGLYV
ncbi:MULTISPECIES: 3-oxoacyl-ACP reductase [Bacillaceae]|uniref:3-oxoacyl-[acyl-carrier-protein] reductase n=1 Tax=Gottfriedia luciferensis TaxID=178774 RepID=A0ABX2ZKN5_9BACI|nr:MULTISPECIES: 3-oxoacyl-ACP reductase [Bacillaceae]ODG89884.1 3-oxoacyl-[acyl-carrier-protein] reductase [Gottfriedia luciferensis]PGZ86304.1 3-oxoacyl-ACP reductase [Bacillus sp. AFS029533]